jgi:hypothetical protein
MRQAILLSLLLLVPLSVSAQAELPKNDRMVMQSIGGLFVGTISAVTIGQLFAYGTYSLITMGDDPNSDKSFGQGLGEAYLSYGLGYSLAYILGSSYAVTYTGNNDNPIKGKWSNTAIGTSAGLFIGVVGMSAMIDSGAANPVLVIAWVFGSTTAGSLIGYNQSRVDVRITPDITRAVTLRIPL